MGNPSVRFDEGREELVIGQGGLSIHPFPPTLLRGNRDNGEAEGSGQKDAERVKKMGSECAVVKSNGIEGESPSGLAEKCQSLERKN